MAGFGVGLCRLSEVDAIVPLIQDGGADADWRLNMEGVVVGIWGFA